MTERPAATATGVQRQTGSGRGDAGIPNSCMRARRTLLTLAGAHAGISPTPHTPGCQITASGP
jgi:hypothetical protein